MSSLNPRVVKTNIREFKPLENDKLVFGQKVPIFRKLKEWKMNRLTRSAWVSQKRRSLASALKEFKDLYEVDEFFADVGKNDDSFQVFYRKKGSPESEVFCVEYDGEIYQAVCPQEFSEHSYPFDKPQECYQYLSELRDRLGESGQKYRLIPLG